MCFPVNATFQPSSIGQTFNYLRVDPKFPASYLVSIWGTIPCFHIFLCRMISPLRPQRGKVSWFYKNTRVNSYHLAQFQGRLESPEDSHSHHGMLSHMALPLLYCLPSKTSQNRFFKCRLFWRPVRSCPPGFCYSKCC